MKLIVVLVIIECVMILKLLEIRKFLSGTEEVTSYER